MGKVGIFGGSFNPPHIGHLMICYYTLSIYGLDEVWLVPVKEHPLGKQLIDIVHRSNMCARLKDSAPGKIKLMYPGNKKYTVDLLEFYKERFPRDKFYLIIGSDIHEELERWKEWGRIQELAEIITIYRHGHLDNSDEEAISSGVVKFPNISSTEIRRRLKAGEDVSNFVPKNILEYINYHNLEF